MTQWLRGLVERLRDRVGRPEFRRLAYVGELYDVPADLDSGVMYIAGSSTAAKWAAFLCPCRTGHRVVLSLQRGHRPSWQLAIEAGAPTIWPSIDVLEARRCHYWIRRGRVRWVPERSRTRLPRL